MWRHSAWCIWLCVTHCYCPVQAWMTSCGTCDTSCWPVYWVPWHRISNAWDAPLSRLNSRLGLSSHLHLNFLETWWITYSRRVHIARSCCILWYRLVNIKVILPWLNGKKVMKSNVSITEPPLVTSRNMVSLATLCGGVSEAILAMLSAGIRFSFSLF